MGPPERGMIVPEYSRFRGSELRAFVVAVFEHYGMPHDDAVVGAEALVHADEMGIDSHGVAHLATHRPYVPGLKDGSVNPRAVPEIVRDSPANALMDAKSGFGPVASTRAMQLAIDKARATGAGFVAVTNSKHYGAAAHYALMAVDHGMIGLSMTIGGLGVVPTYGRERRLGINPLSVAAPANREHPFLLDIATSVVAGGKLELARMRKESIPEGWIVDKAGKPTTDPYDYANGGALLPLGGAPETGSYKGYGLAVMIDIFCGLLTGFGFAAQLGSVDGRPHFFGAWDVATFQPLDRFTAMMDEMIQTLHATQPAEGADRVMVHGDREFAMLRERSQNGIPLHPEVVANLQRVADDTGIALPAPLAV